MLVDCSWGSRLFVEGRFGLGISVFITMYYMVMFVFLFIYGSNLLVVVFIVYLLKRGVEILELEY